MAFSAQLTSILKKLKIIKKASKKEDSKYDKMGKKER